MWDQIGLGLGLVWGRFGVGLGSVRGRFGVGLGSVWGRFGVPGGPGGVSKPICFWYVLRLAVTRISGPY